MKVPRWIRLLPVSLLAAGCIAPAPPARDTLADLNLIPADAGYKKLFVAVIAAQNTKNSIDYLSGILSRTRTRENPASFLLSYEAMLQRHFLSTVKVDSIQEAKTRSPDLIAVLDVHAELPSHSSARFAAKLILISPEEGTEIDTVSAQGEGRGSSLLEDRRLHMSIGTAAEDGRAKLEKALLASRALADYAKARAARGSLARTPPPAPARSIHSDVDVPRYRAPADPDAYALVVGISRYKHLPPADFAERDAEAVRSHLLAMGYPERNVILLTGDDATRTSLQKYLEEWLPKNLKPDSNLFVYYSGHGAPDVKSGEAYLVPWDGDAQFLQSTAYPLRQLFGSLNKLKAGRVLVALDSCFSGAGGRSVLAKGARPLVAKVDMDSGLLGKLVVFSASAADEISGTEEEQGHGLFTYHFLKGLSGAARDKKGKVTVRGLYDYLLPRVQDGARLQNREQTPQLMPAGLGEAAAAYSIMGTSSFSP